MCSMIMKNHQLQTLRYRLFCEYVLSKVTTELESDRLRDGREAAALVQRNYTIFKIALLCRATKISAQTRLEGRSYVELRREFAVIILETLELFLSKHNSKQSAYSGLDVSKRHATGQ